MHNNHYACKRILLDTDISISLPAINGCIFSKVHSHRYRVLNRLWYVTGALALGYLSPPVPGYPQGRLYRECRQDTYSQSFNSHIALTNSFVPSATTISAPCVTIFRKEIKCLNDTFPINDTDLFRSTSTISISYNLNLIAHTFCVPEPSQNDRSQLFCSEIVDL